MNIEKIQDDQVTSTLSSFISLLLLVAVTFVAVASTPAFAKKSNEKEVDISVDHDKDGLSDAYEMKIGTEAYLSDTDGDGLSDGIEVGKNLKKPFNHDGDRLIDALDADDDNDGLPTILEIQLSADSDIDEDGIKNYLDPDSDNDGVNDGLEAGMLGKDTNFDRIDDAFDAQQKGVEDKNGDGIADTIFIPDHNKDGIVDMFDKKFQHARKDKLPSVTVAKSNEKLNKNIPTKNVPTKKDIITENVLAKKESNKKEKAKEIKKAEAELIIAEAKLKHPNNKITKKTKPKKVIVNKNTDTDNDGLLDALEIVLGTNIKKRDSDGDTVSDAIEIGIDPKSPQDSDHDGVIDALDTDDDNDGVITKNEDLNKDGSPINDDTDEDGVPNYLDGNDDGDSRLTLAEGSKKDTDQDGILDYLDKNDTVADFSVDGKKIIKTPDVVVLKESNPKDFDNKPFQHFSENAVEKAIEQQPTLENKQANNTARITNALEKAIATNKKTTRQKYTANDSGPNGKLAKKKQVSLRNKDESIITWITSLLP